MDLDAALAATADSIARMPEEVRAVGLDELRTELQRRKGDDIAWAKHTAFIDSLELEQAAYELGRRHDESGDLGGAARWYRVAAKNDYADAALRLGMVLDLLADRCAGYDDHDAPDTRHQELHLVTEAAHAYSEAYAAGYAEAADKVDEMLAAFTRRQNRPPREPAPARTAPSGHDCSYVREFTPESGVLSENEIQELSRYSAQCLTCMKEFVTLVRAAASALPTGNVTDPCATDDETTRSTGRVRVTACDDR